MAIGQYMNPFIGNGDIHVRLKMCEKFSIWTKKHQQTNHDII